MSTNTTNTNNGTSNGASRPKSSAQKSAAIPGEGAQRFPFASFPLPDAALLERLANEFFLVMPKDLGNGNDTLASHPQEEVESDEIPTTMFSGESLPFQETSRVESAPNFPSPSPSIQTGPLTETDLHAIASSLAGSTAFVPGMPGTTPAQPAGAPPDFLVGEKISPLAVVPKIPAGNEMFSFSGISGMPTSAPTAPPGGADLSAIPASLANAPVVSPPTAGSTPHFLEGEKGASPAAASFLSPTVFPPINELFSFPRVPALPNASGIQTVPNPPAPPMSAYEASPHATDGTVSGAPAPVPASASAIDAKGVAPQVPSAPTAQAPGLPMTDASTLPSSVPGEKGIYPGLATSLPSPSELFSFPGVPGVQSPPGIPILPSSVPTALPTQTDAPSVPGASMPSIETAHPSGAAASKPAPSASRFEFQPDVVPDLGTAKRPLDPRLIRRDFPILEERVHGRQLIWLDNAATTQKPNAVIDRLSHFYQHENSNIHRAAHDLAARATDAYESAREKARRFLNASTTREIIFVRGTTEGINLIAQSWGRRNVQKDDEIVITWLEHHANIVPWQQLCLEKGARLRVAPVNDRGEIILEEYEKLLGPRTRIVSFSQVSNALGTITPAREMVDIAHRYGARVVVDGAQAVSHMRADVQALNCDFYVFSGHKVFGPTGIGVVYGKLDVLENMPPWQGGGNMIADVTFEKTTYQPAPARFEAGTGNIADAVGLGAALDYVEEIGMENIAAYEHELLNYGTAGLLTVPGLRLIGTAREKAGVMSFVLDDMRTEDVGVALNEEGIAVRSGHHCAQPILRRMGVESSVRPSLAFYNTCEELDQLVATLLRIQANRGRR
jgi:cysteine desulfurase / selenocysteine lyase